MASETPGLSVPLNVPLSKFEKQLARAEAAAVKRAQNIERKFNESNGRSGETLSKSAAASAQVFERAMQKETRAFQQLKASIDPAYAAQRRYEAVVKQVEAAVRMGAVTQKDANAVLAQARAAHLGAGTAATAAATQAGSFFKVSNAGRFVIQNTTNQLADMMVQFEMGTAPMRVLGQQLPQVFGGFGALGGALGVLAPILGTVAAIGFPVAAFLLASGENAEDSAEKVKDFAEAFDKAEAALNRANSAVNRAASGDLESLRDAYGEISAEVENLIETLARLEVEKALVATRTAMDKFFTENTGVEDLFQGLQDRQAAMADLRQEIAALEDQQALSSYFPPELAGQLAAMREDLAAMDQMQGISEDFAIDPADIQGIRDARDALEEAVAAGDMGRVSDAIAAMRAALQAAGGDWSKVGDQLAEVEDLTRQTDAMTRRLADASGRVNFDAAASSAGRMADEINRAVDAMYDLRAQGLADLETAKIRYEYRNDPVGQAGALAGAQFDRDTSALRKAGFENVGEEVYYNQQRQEAVDTAREIARLNEASRPARRSSGGRSGGGSKSSSKADDFDLFANSEEQITALERQIEMVGKSRREVAALTAKYELLDAAKEKGIDLDQRSTETGRTLREEIDLQAESIADLTVKAEKYAAQQDFMTGLTQDLKDGLVDAIVEGENFGQVLENVAKQLAKAALQAALFGDGPLSGLFGGGGGGGGLGGILGGLDFFASGTDFAPGGAAVVGEQGPELVRLPRGSKVIPNHRIGQSGGKSQVDVFVHPSGEFDARVRRVSGDVAVDVSSGLITENNRRVSQMQRRGS